MIDDELLLQVGLAQTWSDLQERTVRAVEGLGFGMSSGARIVGRLSSGKANVQSVGNPPDGFVEASRSLDMGLRDPVLTSLLAGPGFVQYDPDFYARAGAGDMADLHGQFGYRHGLAFAMHDHGEVCFYGLDGPDSLPTHVGQLLQVKAMLQLLTVHFQVAAKQLASPRPSSASPALLAEEAECLQWAAAGSIWRAGEVRNLSDAQVIRHVGSAARKLGASTARGAAVVAIRAGVIKP